MTPRSHPHLPALVAAILAGFLPQGKLPHAMSAAAPAPPATAKPAARPTYASVLIKDVPHVVQKPDFCGEVCAAMWLARLGRRLTQDDVFNASGLDPLEGRGCYTKELARALTNLGFRVGAVWYRVDRPIVAQQIETQWKALHVDLLAGVPSIVCMHADASPKASEHFRLVLGYDAATDTVIYHEPAEAAGAYRRMTRAALLALWPLPAEAKQAMVIRLRLEAGLSAGTEPRRDVPSPRPSPGGRGGLEGTRPAAGGRGGPEGDGSARRFTPADYAQHIRQLKRKIPSKGFTVVITPPFVVIGDEPPEVVRRRAEGTVKWAVDKLKQAYFSKDPADILDIWLFQDKESYEKNCQGIFHTKPDTPFGYFSHTDRALVMNIATGGGTLVHEIVHPFVAADFPECPAWFNEGLGSLYEQSGEEKGRIHGYTNWRLRGLQDAIRKKTVPSFKTLCSTTTTEFYDKDRGTNYAQARYLCYYLQQHGLLEKFYHRLHADIAKDPTGYKTLLAVLGREETQMAAFQKEWESYVRKLELP